MAVTVIPLMCVLGSVMPPPVMDLEGVRVVNGGRRLLGEIKRGPAVLTAEDISRLAGLAERRLPPALAEDRNHWLRGDDHAHLARPGLHDP
jgi:hypothetical protein